MQAALVIEILETCIQRRQCKRICLDCKFYGEQCVEAHENALDAVQIRRLRNMQMPIIVPEKGYKDANKNN